VRNVRSSSLPLATPALLALIAALGVGCGGEAAAPTIVEEAAAPTPEIWFEEVALGRGIDFRHRSGHRELFLMPESVSGGAGFFDADGDGDLDAYLVQSGSLIDPAERLPGNQLYENLGDGTFRNITPGSGAEGDAYGMGLACADYDNDGNVDLYITNEGANTLLRNVGGGRFTDVTATAGVGHPGWGSSAGFFDYDRDGFLDLFIVNYVNWSQATEVDCFNTMGTQDYCGPLNYGAPGRDVLYHNNGDGTFTDVTEPSGIAAAFGNGLGVVFGDFTEDGWLDIFVANDATPDQLWVNQQNGTFIDKALLAGCAVDLEGGVPKAGMGTTAGDLDNDGDLDLMVCNLVDETDSLYLNQGGFFTDQTARSGLGFLSRGFTRFGMGWVEFNNDGYLDLYQANGRIKYAPQRYSDDLFAEPNLLFRGMRGPRFEEIEPRGGTAELLAATSRAAAFGDFDNDGGVDILIANKDERAHLLHNVVADRGQWITFRLIDKHGKTAEGVTVEARLAGRSLYRDARSAFSYLACSDPRVHFGLADATRVDDVRVSWLDGTTESFGAFDAGQIVTLRQGESDATAQ
jgi:hypothetical protein